MDSEGSGAAVLVERKKPVRRCENKYAGVLKHAHDFLATSRRSETGTCSITSSIATAAKYPAGNGMSLAEALTHHSAASAQGR